MKTPGNQDAEVTVKLLGEFASHYELTGGTYKTRATITAKPISIATARTQDRSYERNNTSVTILEVTFKDSTNTLVATLTSFDYTATGKMVNANVGTDKKVTVTVTLQGKAADNYKLVSNMTTAKVAITQAKGGVLQEENLKQKFSDPEAEDLHTRLHRTSCRGDMDIQHFRGTNFGICKGGTGYD